MTWAQPCSAGCPQASDNTPRFIRVQLFLWSLLVSPALSKVSAVPAAPIDAAPAAGEGPAASPPPPDPHFGARGALRMVPRSCRVLQRDQAQEQAKLPPFPLLCSGLGCPLPAQPLCLGVDGEEGARCLQSQRRCPLSTHGPGSSSRMWAPAQRPSGRAPPADRQLYRLLREVAFRGGLWGCCRMQGHGAVCPRICPKPTFHPLLFEKPQGDFPAEILL